MNEKYSDKYITLFGRIPVLEALKSEQIKVVKLFVAKKASGPGIKNIIKEAGKRDVEIEFTTAERVKRIAKNGKQDQGVALDVLPGVMNDLQQFLTSLRSSTESIHLIAIDGVTTPANVGLIIRSAAATGIDGVIVPSKGVPGISPLVIKSSAGLVFKSRILRTKRLPDGLRLCKEFGFSIYALAGEGTVDLFEMELPKRAIFVLGNESLGVSRESMDLADFLVRIPMAKGVESLNVACAATLVCYESFKFRAS